MKTRAVNSRRRFSLHSRVIRILLVMSLAPGIAHSQADIDWETYWPGDDEKIIDAINEGELTFLEKPPEQPVHHHHNIFTISLNSLKTGWIEMVQCHENLDTFQRSEIVYNVDRIRKLRVTELRNIGNARVENHTVQLTDVKSNARICVMAESRALASDEDGTYLLQNGPFMRKFLDGYFPMHVTIDIRHPENLGFASIEPAAQKGFEVTTKNQGVHLDAWFEGRLLTRIRFKQVQDTKRKQDNTRSRPVSVPGE